MRIKKTVCGLLLSAVLLASATACSDGTLKSLSVKNVSTDTATQVSSTYDYAKSAEVMSSDTLIMTVGSESSVYWSEYYYWMSVAVKNIVGDLGEIEAWDEIEPYSYDMYGQELTYDEFVKYYAYDAIMMYRTIEKKFDETELTLADGDVYTVEDYANLGYSSKDELLQALSDSSMSQELFEYVQEVSAKYYVLLESVYGVQGADCPNDEVLTYAESKGYMMVKQILISSDTENAQEKANEILSALQGLSGTALETAFDEQMNLNSEDAGLSLYPQGYLFTADDFADEFVAAAQALGEYELSSVVETDNGYHIILRLPISPDIVPYGETESIRYLTAYDRFDSIVTGWQQEMTVKYEDSFDQIIPSEIFVN